jgi:hypothetical protein
MVLKPGQTTTLSVPMYMHGDMGGLHDFRVHLATNDPANGMTELQILSNWQ